MIIGVLYFVVIDLDQIGYIRLTYGFISVGYRLIDPV